jgi:hypothetical protein
MSPKKAKNPKKSRNWPNIAATESVSIAEVKLEDNGKNKRDQSKLNKKGRVQ